VKHKWPIFTTLEGIWMVRSRRSENASLEMVWSCDLGSNVTSTRSERKNALYPIFKTLVGIKIDLQNEYGLISCKTEPYSKATAFLQQWIRGLMSLLSRGIIIVSVRSATSVILEMQWRVKSIF
jgi:hypothetical protein